MAGGFDGMGVTDRRNRTEPPNSSRAGLMVVTIANAQNPVDKLYKYLINKDIIMDLLNYR